MTIGLTLAWADQEKNVNSRLSRTISSVVIRARVIATDNLGINSCRRQPLLPARMHGIGRFTVSAD
jgi:hypothetical protein